MRRLALLFLLSAALEAVFLYAVFAAEPDKRDPALSQWFRDLRQPCNNTETPCPSCCSVADGHILRDGDWRVAGNGYQVRIDGQWRDIPPRAVLSGVSNPTGGAVIFIGVSGTIFCFVRPTDT